MTAEGTKTVVSQGIHCRENTARTGGGEFPQLCKQRAKQRLCLGCGPSGAIERSLLEAEDQTGLDTPLI